MHITRQDDATHNDRRLHDRSWTVRGCRVRALARVRSEPAETANLSSGGALIRIGSTTTFAIGDEVEIAVARDGQGLLRADDAIRAVVRRVVPMDFHHQAIGVQFLASAANAISGPQDTLRNAA